MNSRVLFQMQRVLSRVPAAKIRPESSLRTIRHMSTRCQNARTPTASASRLLLGGVLATAVCGGGVVAFSTGATEAQAPRSYSGITAMDVPLGDKYPYVIPVVVEVSQGAREKYEMDEELRMLKMRRVIRSAVFFPHNYGFVPQTKRRHEEQPLDVLIMGGDQLIPGCLVDVRPLGYIMMEDEDGIEEKLLAVVDSDPRYKNINKMRDVPEHLLREISHFFETYLALENKNWKKIGGWKGTEDAVELIEEAHLRYLTQKKIVREEVRRYATRR